MKNLLLTGLILTQLPVYAVDKGASRNAVLAELGDPDGSMRNASREILLFKTGTVTLQNGTVTETDLSPDYVRQAEERAKKAEAARAARQTELEQQKQLYPEDHFIRINCIYDQNENRDSLPDAIRPLPGSYSYDVYIPPGYHDPSGRFYKCLFLESPVLWDSVKERIRKEKWITVILPDAGPEQIVRTMNGNFAAAFDDASARFRISKEHIFIAGRVPAAVFAILRPVAGIILQEPDFSGLEKAGITRFTGRNPNLRAYVMLGNTNPDHVRRQGNFIADRIPRHYIGIYEGNTPVLPVQFADQAIDWMKKEYALP